MTRTVLVPRLGMRTAELLEMPVMLIVIVLAAGAIVRRFDLARAANVRFAVGFGALGLLVAAELLMTIALQPQPLAQYLGARDPVSGAVYLVMLLVFGCMPYLLLRTRSRRNTGESSSTAER